MPSPTLMAKLALTLGDPKLWEKIIVIAIAVFLLLTAFLGSCGAMTYTDLGFESSELFSAQINEYNAVFASGERINDKLLYAVYPRGMTHTETLLKSIMATDGRRCMHIKRSELQRLEIIYPPET